METQKMPFEITPQIKRYLEDIIFLVEEGPKEAYKSPLFYFVSFYKLGEKQTPKQDANRERFWRYLEKQNVIKGLSFSSKPDKELEDLLYPKNILTKDRTFSVCKREDNNGVDSVFTLRISLSYDHAFKKGMDELGKNTGPGFIFFLKDDVSIKNILGRIESEEAKEQKEFEQKAKVQPIELPEGTRWQDITIRFIDNGDHVEISTKKITRNATYQEMGFEDTRKRRPNAQWQFLRLLALPQFSGELSWEKLNSFGITNPKERISYKKKKQLLAKTLKNYFPVHEDPFRSYRKEGSYKIKISLITSPDQQEIRQYEDKDDISPETKEYLNENAPSVYEKEKEDNGDY